MAPPTLSQYISRKRVIPPKAHGTPYLLDGNILLVTERNAFRFDKRTLISQCTEFARKVASMNDGTTDVVEGAVVLELPSWVSSLDLGAFLDALWETPQGFPLDTLEDFYRLSGVLRLSSIFGAPHLKQATTAALQARYPATLAGWDHVRPPIAPPNPHIPLPRPCEKPWERDRALVINLAREMGTFSILPAAMAMLANDCSAGEVFGIRLPNSPWDKFQLQHVPPSPSVDLFSPVDDDDDDEQQEVGEDQLTRTPLNHIDAPSFALTKEHSHHCCINLLLSIRSLAATCTRPPQRLPPTAGRAPVGASTLLPGASRCMAFFKEVSLTLLESLVLESPVGFPDFAPRVLAVSEDPTRVCRACWKAFNAQVKEGRERWWEGLPRVVGLEGEGWAGWADERLASVEM